MYTFSKVPILSFHIMCAVFVQYIHIARVTGCDTRYTKEPLHDHRCVGEEASEVAIWQTVVPSVYGDVWSRNHVTTSTTTPGLDNVNLDSVSVRLWCQQVAWMSILMVHLDTPAYTPRWAEVRSGAWRCAPPSTSYMQNAPLCTPAHLQSYPDSGVQGGAHLPAPPGLSHLLIAFISNCMAEVLLRCAPPSTSRT